MLRDKTLTRHDGVYHLQQAPVSHDVIFRCKYNIAANLITTVLSAVSTIINETN